MRVIAGVESLKDKPASILFIKCWVDFDNDV